MTATNFDLPSSLSLYTSHSHQKPEWHIQYPSPTMTISAYHPLATIPPSSAHQSTQQSPQSPRQFFVPTQTFVFALFRLSHLGTVKGFNDYLFNCITCYYCFLVFAFVFISHRLSPASLMSHLRSLLCVSLSAQTATPCLSSVRISLDTLSPHAFTLTSSPPQTCQTLNSTLR